MGKKNKKSSTPGDDLAKTKKHKRFSTTEVETARVPSSMSLKNGKSVLEPGSTSKENLKKQISEEIKEMSKSIKELTEAVKRQEEILQTIADQHEGKDEGAAEDFCNFECEEAMEDHDNSIIVKGFDKDMGRRRDVKKVLRNVFGSCGKIKSIFVPIACQTGGGPLEYAFITFEDWQGGNEKALKMNGDLLEGRQLEVKLARGSGLLHGYSDSGVGCTRCLLRFSHGIPLQKSLDIPRHLMHRQLN
ncbi:Nucleolin 1 [Cardamine amara subsp. amara]|uniref:Nucleolin 1 n=1 Tax=Cardamine amara subsp. amara TaxID=228776 RepID=A0ABD1B526_CARAN